MRGRRDVTHRFYLPACTRKQVVWLAFHCKRLPNNPLSRFGAIKKILQHLGLWEDAHAPADSDPARAEITLDLSCSQSM
jgi:hypothetical protein